MYQIRKINIENDVRQAAKFLIENWPDFFTWYWIQVALDAF